MHAWRWLVLCVASQAVFQLAARGKVPAFPFSQALADQIAAWGVAWEPAWRQLPSGQGHGQRQLRSCPRLEVGPVGALMGGSEQYGLWGHAVFW